MTSGMGSTRAVEYHTDLQTVNTTEYVFNIKYKGEIWELLRHGVQNSELKITVDATNVMADFISWRKVICKAFSSFT